MTVLTCASTGKSIILLSEIVNSGEAKIWRTNQNGYLAKIYHSPTPERVQKLAVMIAHPPTEPNSHLHHVSFAWPKSALKNAQGDCVGFLMPEIKDGKELLDVYNPRRRKALKLEIDWRFLHTTALNIVSIIEALHAAGYVLGDIKPQNILVNNRALPSIIDTDSFQVKNPKNGKVYYCLVGSEGYTPPELIGKDFDSIEQTEIHDRFRLGVIIYQLLFGGNNPFQGKWTGAGETPDINELICQGLWVNGSTNLIAAVARTIPLEIVHPEVQQCFLKCFNDGHKNPNFRPTARKWLEALKVGNDRLTICGRVDSHYYSRTYGKCYWCDRSTNLGVDIFPGVVKAKPSAVVESTSKPQVVNKVSKPGDIPIFSGHSGWVKSVAFSPDGQTLASGSGDNTIKLWNVNTGKLLQTLPGHSSAVSSLAYSPDGQTLASGSYDHTIKLWNVTTGKLLQTLPGHSQSIRSVAFSPDGQTLASGSADETIKLWDVTTGKLLQTFPGHSDSVNSVVFSPDGQTLASGSGDNTIKLWDVATERNICTFQAFNAVNSVVFSPDGKTLATGNDDKNIKLWDMSIRTQIHTFQGHSDWVYSVAFSPDGQTLASGSADNTIKLWDVTKGKLLQTLTGHSEWVYSVAYSPDGQTLASGSGDNTIMIWPIAATINQAPVQQPQSQVSPPPVSKLPSQPVTIPAHQTTIPVKNTKLRKLLIAAILGFIGTQIYGYLRYDVFPVNPISIIASLPSGIFLERTLSGHSRWVGSVAYSPDGQTLASGSRDTTIKLWDVKTGNLLQTLTGHSYTVWSVAYSPNGQTLASGSSDKTIKLWNVNTGKLLQTLTGHSDEVYSVAYSPDGQTLATGSNDNTIKLWDVKTGNLLQTLTGHSYTVYSVAYSPDGQTLASGSRDKTIKLWDVKTGNLLQTLTGHSNTVYSVEYSPDGQTLATGSYDHTIKLWNVKTGNLLQTLAGHSNSVWSVEYSPDGQTLASGSQDGTIKLWNVKTGNLLQTLTGHSSSVWSVALAYSPDGKTLASGSWDRTIKIWRLK
ncbi:protein kinase domain-containing protein [Anabaena lutea]|uniref:Protein kinase domain-containing protein n=1 Tax=Anabaena lutea FACHB-196 TaxID=2692881 RepID=A0ABR8FIP8_9NOST|nr:hypothetical protein [Anabaena lutea]MBD2568630.1 hypothetical protein [Anabaena lutea FACHB-196]